MGEFRIGRKFAQHFYPEPRLSSSIPGANLGSNYASGPDQVVAIPLGGISVEWSDIASGAPETANVPVNALDTGRLLIHGVICVKNGVGNSVSIQVEISVDGTTPLPVPLENNATCLANGYLSIPFLVQTDPLSIGPHTVTVTVIPTQDGALSLATNSSTIKIQEVEDPT